jgi:hypothetical protein
MKARLIAFGRIEVEGEHYEHDIVIEAGVVKERRRGDSKSFRSEYGHTPLSIAENIPWGTQQLIVGTGVYGKLPVTPEVEAEAKRRGIKLIALPTGEACEYLARLKPEETHAILHVTC